VLLQAGALQSSKTSVKGSLFHLPSKLFHLGHTLETSLSKERTTPKHFTHYSRVNVGNLYCNHPANQCDGVAVQTKAKVSNGNKWVRTGHAVASGSWANPSLRNTL